MKKAYRYVIERALADGHKVAIWSCEGLCWETPFLGYKIDNAMDRLVAAVESQDWTNIVVRGVGEKGYSDPDDVKGTFAVILEAGQAPEETINDYSITPWSENVMEQYEAVSA